MNDVQRAAAAASQRLLPPPTSHLCGALGAMASPPLVVVLTGGSGVGKTTLIDRLASLGFGTVPEAAMQVIDSLNTLLDPEQQLAWRSTHKTAFGNLVGTVALQQEQRARGKKKKSAQRGARAASAGSLTAGNREDAVLHCAGF